MKTHFYVVHPDQTNRIYCPSLVPFTICLAPHTGRPRAAQPVDQTAHGRHTIPPSFECLKPASLSLFLDFEPYQGNIKIRIGSVFLPMSEKFTVTRP